VHLAPGFWVHWALINAGRGFACWSQRSVAFNTARGGSHVALRVDDARVGRELLRRLTPHVDSAANWWRPASAWMSIAISYAGFEALGLPQNSLASFPEAFCVGMAARAQQLRDLGVNCLDYVVVFGERHLRHLLESYQRYYNEARTHLSLDKDAPVSRAVEADGSIIAKPHLGGLHHQYVRI
jgi:hypothetical protein